MATPNRFQALDAAPAPGEKSIASDAPVAPIHPPTTSPPPVAEGAAPSVSVKDLAASSRTATRPAPEPQLSSSLFRGGPIVTNAQNTPTLPSGSADLASYGPPVTKQWVAHHPMAHVSALPQDGFWRFGMGWDGEFVFSMLEPWEALACCEYMGVHIDSIPPDPLPISLPISSRLARWSSPLFARLGAAPAQI